MINSKNKVIFFQIKDVKTKLVKIIKAAIYHFERKEKLLIQVQDEPSLRYVDGLLWQFPKEGFLPHVTSDESCSDFIVITKKKKNINKASYLFSLSPDLIDINKSYKIIYDFDDYTSPVKQQKSKRRYELYRQAAITIESK